MSPCTVERVAAQAAAADGWRWFMFREQMIGFLETVIVFLLLTNALSAIAATYALWMASGVRDRKLELVDAAERKIGAFFRRAA